MNLIKICLAENGFPVWKPMPMKDQSWKELSNKLQLTASNPGPIEIDLDEIPEEALLQIQGALKKEKITTNVEASQVLMYNLKREIEEEKNKKDNSLGIISKEQIEIAKNILDKSAKEIEKELVKLLDTEQLKIIHAMFQLESVNKKRKGILNKLKKATEDFMNVVSFGKENKNLILAEVSKNINEYNSDSKSS